MPGKNTGRDPREIPLPEIKTAMAPLPGAKDLPVRTAMPNVLTMSDGTKVTNARQWQKRREEMRKLLAPEPASFGLAMFGFAAAGFGARRRRAAR
jgi:hypothetical protein